MEIAQYKSAIYYYYKGKERSTRRQGYANWRHCMQIEINTNQILNQNVVLEDWGKPEYPGKNLSEQRKGLTIIGPIGLFWQTHTVLILKLFDHLIHNLS